MDGLPLPGLGPQPPLEASGTHTTLPFCSHRTQSLQTEWLNQGIYYLTVPGVRGLVVVQLGAS